MNTAVKVGVSNLETDLFTNVNQLCPSCDTWSAQAGKLLGNVHMCPSQCPICAQHVYKLGYSLHTRATAWALLAHYTGTAWIRLVHWSYCLDTPCTLELLLGHSLHTSELLLGHTLHTRATAWALLAHHWALPAH